MTNLNSIVLKLHISTHAKNFISQKRVSETQTMRQSAQIIHEKIILIRISKFLYEELNMFLTS